MCRIISLLRANPSSSSPQQDKLLTAPSLFGRRCPRRLRLALLAHLLNIYQRRCRRTRVHVTAAARRPLHGPVRHSYPIKGRLCIPVQARASIIAWQFNLVPPSTRAGAALICGSHTLLIHLLDSTSNRISLLPRAIAG